MPRGGHYNPGRQNVYDRSPSGQALFYNAAGVAPHGATVRFTRTVPAGMRAVLQSAFANILRVTAAGTPGLSVAWVETTIGGVTTRPLSISQLTNGVGDTQHDGYSGDVLLNAGDVVAGQTSDAAVTGTVNYTLSAVATEFSQ